MTYLPTILETTHLGAVADAMFRPCPTDGVVPEGFFGTSNLPTYVKHHGTWRMPMRPRMDGVIRANGDALETIEPRRVKAGDLVAVGIAEDGTEGIYVDGSAIAEPVAWGSAFRFMSSSVSRERPVDYEGLAAQLIAERDAGGFVVWVPGPAVVHSRARADMMWFIEQGFVGAMLTGNAVATHDIEASMFGTTLGMSDHGKPVGQGHSHHLRAINRVRAAGSIEKAVESGLIRDGIMASLVRKKVPYVLAGSIRDDGPLPGVLTDAVAAQDAMREVTIKATGALFIATALHAIAVGNLLPAFYLKDKRPAPIFTICVDQTEFLVSKLKDRGTHHAYGVVTNAQDFMSVLRRTIELALEKREHDEGEIA